MALIDDFKDRFPNFSGSDIDNVFSFLEAEYKCYYNYEYGFSSCSDQAILNLLAHLFILNQSQSESSDPIKEMQSVSDGTASITYQQRQLGSDVQDYFNTTIYGQKFLQMTRLSGVGFFV